jgi:uncharacterized protein (DUF1810 family)
MSLDRFKAAQASPDAGFTNAIAELDAGRKSGHWIWYIFPQLGELGHSSMARFYGLRDLAEACDYLGDPLLRERLLLVTHSVAERLSEGIRLTELMGSTIDSAKLVSSLTLFQFAARKLAESSALPVYGELAELSERVLVAADDQGFPLCQITLLRCAGEGSC